MTFTKRLRTEFCKLCYIVEMSELVRCTTASEFVRKESTAELLLFKGGSQSVEINNIRQE